MAFALAFLLLVVILGSACQTSMSSGMMFRSPIRMCALVLLSDFVNSSQKGSLLLPDTP